METEEGNWKIKAQTELGLVYNNLELVIHKEKTVTTENEGEWDGKEAGKWCPLVTKVMFT